MSTTESEAGANTPAPLETVSPTPGAARNGLSSYLPSNLRESGIYIAFALIIVLFAFMTDGQ